MRLEQRIGTLMLAVLFVHTMVSAQQKDPRVSAPIAPLPPLTVGESSSTADVAPQPATAPGQPRQPAASEIEQMSLGAWGGGRSMLLYGFRVGFHADSNPSASAGTARLQSVTSIGWNASLQRIWRTSTLGVDYSSGAMLYNTRPSENRDGHALGLRYSLAGRSWTLTLRDSVSFLPESSFGFWSGIGAATLPGAPGQVQSQLNPLLVPSQSILTGTGRRISNTVAGQLGFALTPRSTVSFSSSHGILRSLNSGLIDSHQWSAGASYSYLLTARDSVGLSYSHSRFGYEKLAFGMSGDTLSVVYSRQLTGRLSLQVGGGPHFNRFHNPVAGNGTRVTSNIRAGLQYQMANTSLDLSYMRGITGGSGVLVGANTDVIEGGMSKVLSRQWSMNARLGYAHNSSLVQSTGLTNRLTFHGWHGEVGFSRPVGRYARMGFTYGFNGERSNSAFCLNTPCSRTATRHRFGLTFQFSPRFPPIILE